MTICPHVQTSLASHEHRACTTLGTTATHRQSAVVRVDESLARMKAHANEASGRAAAAWRADHQSAHEHTNSALKELRATGVQARS
eukprot:2669928-Pleurochrysis_carterae.AAC.1